MLKKLISSPQDRRLPKQDLELAIIQLKNTQSQTDPVLLLSLCKNAEAALSRIKEPSKKALVTQLSIEEQSLHDGIASAYLELANLFESLKCSKKAKACFMNAKKWDHPRPAQGLDPSISSATDSTAHNIAQVHETIFPDDARQPTIKCVLPLPEADGRFKDTFQLAYCLGLLQMTLSPEEAFEQSAGEWVQATENNPKEKERIQKLATDSIRAFTHDELKDARAVAEVVCLAPVLEKNDFRYLLNLFNKGINQPNLLNFDCLEGLAQLMQSAPMGYLDANDLVTILDNLHYRLLAAHSQSSDHIYNLAFAVSHVLDAMADLKVSGLKRVDLHEPLSVYFNGLRASSDPDLVYQAAYAFQALQRVPDDESPWQAAMRRTGVVLKGAFGLAMAIKGLDVNGFIEELGYLQDGLNDVYQAAKIAYKGARAPFEGGEGLLESLKAGLSFNQKHPWYTALRGTDTLLRDGQLAKFRTLVCKAPCRRDVAFQLGVCQRLGNLAASVQWDTGSRQGAVAFLGEIYRNDDMWSQHSLVKRQIIHILIELSSLFGSNLLGVEPLLQDLELNGDKTKKILYQQCRKEHRSSHWLKVTSTTFLSPSLLDQVQSKPDIGGHLRRLQKQCLEGQGNAVYIPPQAKASLQASDDQLFGLTERVQTFLESKDKVMLLLGTSGGGKSTFNRQLEHDLWNAYKGEEDRIPLLINLPSIDKPERDLIAKHLHSNDFTEPQIQEMRHHHKFIMICDGYDEAQLVLNLYTSNQMNQPGQWDVQMVISCRSEYLPPGYHDHFRPMDRNCSTPLGLFQEAVIAPFSEAQIHNYISQYVLTSRPVWKTEDYLEALGKVPDLWDIVKNPFLLTLSLEVLPHMVDAGQDVLATRITRVALYDRFLEDWLERGKKRLIENKDLGPEEKKDLKSLSDKGFSESGVAFLKALAAAIYKEQAGRPVVEYMHSIDHRTWKQRFFGQKGEDRLLREACPLTRNGNQYRFMHNSLLEYCLARAVFEPRHTEGMSRVASTQASLRRGSTHSVMSFENKTVAEESVMDIDQVMLESPLAQRSFVDEPSILQFLAERVRRTSLQATTACND